MKCSDYLTKYYLPKLKDVMRDVAFDTIRCKTENQVSKREFDMTYYDVSYEIYDEDTPRPFGAEVLIKESWVEKHTPEYSVGYTSRVFVEYIVYLEFYDKYFYPYYKNADGDYRLIGEYRYDEDD